MISRAQRENQRVNRFSEHEPQSELYLSIRRSRHGNGSSLR